MKPAAARAEIHATLVARGFTIADGCCPTFAGAVRVHGKKVDVLLEVPDTRLIERPRVHLVDRTQIDPEVLAHVEVDTGICYASGAGLPLDNMRPGERSEEHTSELQSLMRISYAVFCMKTKTKLTEILIKINIDVRS